MQQALFRHKATDTTLFWKQRQLHVGDLTP